METPATHAARELLSRRGARLRESVRSMSDAALMERTDALMGKAEAALEADTVPEHLRPRVERLVARASLSKRGG